MSKSKDETIAIMTRAVNSMAELMDKSVGVAGLHRNGDLATWAELRRGGRFDGWLSDVDDALDEVARLKAEAKQ